MTIEERVEKLEADIQKISEKRKDWWDKFGIITAALIPLTIAIVGGGYTYWSQKAETEIAEIRADAESKIKQAELVSKFFDPLTGTDDEKKKFAVDALLVAAPDYGPVLVRVAAKNTAYARTALDERRDSLIRQMFGEDAKQRQDAYRQLLESWGDDASLVSALLKYGYDNKSNENGVYNALVLLSHMQRDTIKPQESEIADFAKAVEANGPKTKERADILRERLRK